MLGGTILIGLAALTPRLQYHYSVHYRQQVATYEREIRPLLSSGIIYTDAVQRRLIRYYESFDPRVDTLVRALREVPDSVSPPIGKAWLYLNGHTQYLAGSGQSDWPLWLRGIPERSKPVWKYDITSYNVLLNFTYFGATSQINYGFEFDGFNTDFRFRNPVGITFTQRDFTTQLAGYLKLKQTIGSLILEPGIRVQYYASQSQASIEPRLGMKWNATDFLRFKAAGGLYSQNLISTVNDTDIVNFFVGFLAGPEETIRKPNGDAADDRLQHAVHGIVGLELDLGRQITMNLEGYYKGFTQLIEINRNKLDPRDPDFVTETGSAYGGDISLKYQGDDLYLWTTYSLGYVRRDDGQQIYPTTFDRRHNVNVLASYLFGPDDNWELGARWNFGSAFPFTQTQGFYENVPVSQNPVLIDILTGNYNLDFLLSEDRNGGRLADFHRLDLSLKRTFSFGQYGRLELDASVTNAYNRENIFYVDRVTNRRVNQLPVLPSLGVTYAW